MLRDAAGIMFQDRKNAPTRMVEHLNKFFPQIEKQLPNDGFVNGLGFPTVADVAVLNMVRGGFPFALSIKEVNYAVPPKMAALAERTANAPGVKEYLAASKSFAVSPLK